MAFNCSNNAMWIHVLTHYVHSHTSSGFKGSRRENDSLQRNYTYIPSDHGGSGGGERLAKVKNKSSLGCQKNPA